MGSDSLTGNVKQQDRSTAAITLEIHESDDPLLLGNKCMRIRSSRYIRRAKLLRPHGLRARPDRRRDIVFESEISHLLVADLLEKAGWKMATHSLGHGTHPLTHDPIEFIERIQRGHLSGEMRAFLSRRYAGTPGGLRFDLLIANKRHFALLEIKSTMKDSPTFYLGGLGQLLFYLQAAELGIPVKFVHVKFLDSWKIALARFPEGELVRNGAISPRVNTIGGRDGVFLSLLILNQLVRNPGLTPLTIASELDQGEDRVEFWLATLRNRELIARVSEFQYCPKCNQEFPGHPTFCPLCSIRAYGGLRDGHRIAVLLHDRSSYSITDKGLEELHACAKLLLNHREFVSKQILTLFDNI